MLRKYLSVCIAYCCMFSLHSLGLILPNSTQDLTVSDMSSFGSAGSGGAYVISVPQSTSEKNSKFVTLVTVDIVDNHGSGYLGMARWFNVHR